MDPLLEGHRRFREEIWPAQHERYEALAKAGQRPATMVVACSDSRVDPQTVFGAGPGELFVVRNVAGLIPPYEPEAQGHHGTSAALEFAVQVLGVSRLVLLGHAQCGGVQAMIEGVPRRAGDFLELWLRLAEASLRPLPEGVRPEDRMTYYETEVLRVSMKNLMSFPWIAAAVNAGRLTLQAYRFAIMTGQLERLDGERLVPVTFT